MKGALLLIVLLFVGAAYADRTGSPDIWGPYLCTACTLGTPMPDAGTQAYISTMEQYNYPGLPFIADGYKDPGDKYIICNGSYCATYTRTDSGGFLGGDVTPQQDAGGGGDGGGTAYTPGDGGGGLGGYTPIYTCTSAGGGPEMCTVIYVPAV